MPIRTASRASPERKADSARALAASMWPSSAFAASIAAGSNPRGQRVASSSAMRARRASTLGGSEAAIPVQAGVSWLFFALALAEARAIRSGSVWAMRRAFVCSPAARWLRAASASAVILASSWGA